MTKKDTKKVNKSSEEKLILFEAVRDNPTEDFIIIGALSNKDLLTQYEYEKSVYGKEDIIPSITETELNKIIIDFIGE